jgi:hemerythrin-like domain-containing protein
MRRSEALAPLSRDHHHALVIAAALERADRDRAREAAARFVDFLAAHELAHFALEESLLLPAVRDEETGRTLVERVVKDHAYLRGACERIRCSQVAPDVSFLHTVGARLREHVRVEERELFPLLEESLEPATLEEIGTRLRADGSAESA